MDYLEAFGGFPTNGLLDQREGFFTMLALASFFVFEGAYSISKRGGFYLHSTTFLSCVLSTNDAFHSFSGFLWRPGQETGEWTLASVALASLCVNVFIYHRADRSPRPEPSH